MTTRQSYTEELESLQESIGQMGRLASEAVVRAMEAMAKQDTALAARVIEEDDILDEMEVDIESRCLSLIARQQPLAGDLRVIATGMKIATDLERIGDAAVDIARIALRIGSTPLIKPLVDLPRMAQMAETMLADSLRAYRSRDIALAETVCQADDAVDELYSQIFRELLTYMMERPQTISQATDLIFAARHLERVADHATNIGEWVIYLATARRIHA
ncbi:MAG: phosphate signaling complex protein PhoU [Selenomonadales bacterium]|nr:phosphate signaling complex protein PhoU [Selenomonadales bacterium]